MTDYPWFVAIGEPIGPVSYAAGHVIYWDDEMARTAGSKNTKPQLDPLLAALIARLPKPGTNWPTKDRVAWLEMTERALDVVYPRDVPGQTNPNTPHGFHLGLNGGAKPPKPADHSFYIDIEGYARMAGGERINAHEVDGDLIDLRGEGDLGAVTWADGSKGVLGKVLSVKPA